MSRPSQTMIVLLAAVALAAVTLLAFWPVLGDAFVNYDDAKYVTKNPRVQQGLSGSGLRWALTTDHAANWHPLTWLSHMLDWELYGAGPRGHHLTSLLLHVANTLLLFFALLRLTGEIQRGALVAALFALHPLHVEPVAWIAERKELLATLFWILAMLAYLRYVRRPGVRTYLPLLLALVAGLLAKPMLVTIPLVLFLLDLWPLKRWGGDRGALPTPGARRVILEKIPLLVVAAGSGLITLWAQQGARTIGNLASFSLYARISNALVSYVAYLGKLFWPTNLAVFYPHPRDGIPFWKATLAALLLLAVTALALRLRRRLPYLLVGWLWYLVTLLPVIGLVQVGLQGMADRYTYVPLIGPFVIVVWGLADVGSKLAGSRRSGGATPSSALSRTGEEVSGEKVSGTFSPKAKRFLTPFPLILVWFTLPFLFGATRAQLKHWKNSTALWTHAISSTGPNAIAQWSLGTVLAAEERYDEAIWHYSEALQIDPTLAEAHNALGVALAAQGWFGEAIDHYRQAIELKPSLALAHRNMAHALDRVDRPEEALEHYEEAARAEPENVEALNDLGSALIRDRRADDAEKPLRRAIEIRPGYAKAHSNLAAVLLMQGKYAEAWEEIAVARRQGFEPPSELIRYLSERMPEPGTEP